MSTGSHNLYTMKYNINYDVGLSHQISIIKQLQYIDRHKQRTLVKIYNIRSIQSYNIIILVYYIQELYTNKHKQQTV